MATFLGILPQELGLYYSRTALSKTNVWDFIIASLIQKWSDKVLHQLSLATPWSPSKHCSFPAKTERFCGHSPREGGWCDSFGIFCYLLLASVRRCASWGPNGCHQGNKAGFLQCMTGRLFHLQISFSSTSLKYVLSIQERGGEAGEDTPLSRTHSSLFSGNLQVYFMTLNATNCS